MASDDAQRDADARRMLGRQLREFRTKAKRSQRECAELAGIGRVAWTLIENGRQSITCEILGRVMRAVDRDVTSLVPALRAA